MMFKKMRKRILTVTVCAALVLQSPVFMNPAYAEPADQETEVSVSENEYGSETGEAASENGAGYENEDTLSVNDAVSKAEKAASENSSGTGTEGPVSGNEAVPENEEGEEVTGGYIEMPWDNDTPIVSRRLEYDDALEMIVEENEADEDIIQEYIPSLDRYVETQNGDPKFPTGTDEEILAYLKEKYPATRSQSPYGTCWAHSSVALAEFYLISHGLKDGNGTVDRDVNYSELALAYFCYNQAPDPVNGNTGDTVVFDSTSGKQNNFLDFGGNLSFSSQSLMRYNGVTNDEGDAAYSNAGTVLSSGLDASYASSRDTAHLKNVYHLNIRENPKLVKQAIKENGIAGVSIYADSRYMNTEHKSYYNNVNDSTNHAVAIVGWDDNFPKEYFNTEPLGNGAWLVRNSWTVNTAFSYYSYFWLSYEDTSLADTAYIFEMADPDRGEYYDNNYNYDSQLHNVATAGSTTAANIFEAAKNAETLKAVQIDSTINIAGSYNIKVYKNLSDSSDPESGTLCASAEGTIPFAGKYTIPLSGAVELTEGESFSIVVTTEKKIDQEMDFNWLEQVVMDTVVNRGESFIKSNDVWKDLADKSLSNKYGNLCIRALTDTKGEASLPDRITSLSVKGRTDQSISLAWSAARDASGYEVWYSDSENGTYSKAGETSASEKKYRHTGLSAGTTYYYRVYPVRNGSRYEEGASPVLSASTSAGTPQVEVSNIGNYTAMASWPALDSCDGYEYEVWKGNSYFSPVSISENRIRLKQLDPGTEHTLKVRSYKENAGGTKSYSEYCIVTFTTLNGSGHTV
ncbi:MAG: fibronectin type III domain-containing protein, partial [Lachnospiraceae bacterium]|nr:fibronectin type III domain-containing protein [Lachnospiraceae bacterium]